MILNQYTQKKNWKKSVYVKSKKHLKLTLTKLIMMNLRNTTKKISGEVYEKDSNEKMCCNTRTMSEERIVTNC